MNIAKFLTQMIWGDTGNWIDPAYKNLDRNEDAPEVPYPIGFEPKKFDWDRIDKETKALKDKEALLPSSHKDTCSGCALCEI